MGNEYRYSAFISYRHVEPDRAWAKWLHRSLETYRVPKSLQRQGLPARVGRVFRDEEELPVSSDLSSQITMALDQSQYLIVVCSLHTPLSQWCNAEIEYFRTLGRHDRIIALLIEGEPYEAFPKALCEIRKNITTQEGEKLERIESVEPLAADVRPSRREPLRHLKRMAKLRMLACLLGCNFDDLRNREKERKNKRLVASAAVVAIALASSAFAVNNWWDTRQELLLAETMKVVDGYSYDVENLLAVLPKSGEWLPRPYPDAAKRLLYQKHADSAPLVSQLDGEYVTDEDFDESGESSVVNEDGHNITRSIFEYDQFNLVIEGELPDNWKALLDSIYKNVEEMPSDWTWRFYDKKGIPVSIPIPFGRREEIEKVVERPDNLIECYVREYRGRGAEWDNYDYVRFTIDLISQTTIRESLDEATYYQQVQLSGFSSGALYIDGVNTGILSNGLDYLGKREDGHRFKRGENTLYYQDGKFFVSDRGEKSIIGVTNDEHGERIFYDDCSYIDTETRSIYRYRLPYDGGQCVAIDPTRAHLFVLTGEQSVNVYDLGTLNHIRTIDFTRFQSVYPDGSRLMFWPTGDLANRYTLGTYHSYGSPTYAYSLDHGFFSNAAPLLDVTYDKTSRSILSLFGGSITVSQPDSGPQKVTPLNRWISSGRIFTTSIKGLVAVLDSATGSLDLLSLDKAKSLDRALIQGPVRFAGTNSKKEFVVVSDDKYHIIQATSDARLSLKSYELPVRPPWLDIVSNDMGLSLVTSQGDWVDISGGKIMRETPLGRVDSVALGHEGQSVLAAQDDRFFLYTLAPQGTIIATELPIHESLSDNVNIQEWHPACLSLSKDGKLALAGIASEQESMTGYSRHRDFIYWDIESQTANETWVSGGEISADPQFSKVEFSCPDISLSTWQKWKKLPEGSDSLPLVVPWSDQYELEIASYFGYGGSSVWRFVPSFNADLLSWTPKPVSQYWNTEQTPVRFQKANLPDLASGKEEKGRSQNIEAGLQIEALPSESPLSINILKKEDMPHLAEVFNLEASWLEDYQLADRGEWWVKKDQEMSALSPVDAQVIYSGQPQNAGFDNVLILKVQKDLFLAYVNLSGELLPKGRHVGAGGSIGLATNKTKVQFRKGNRQVINQELYAYLSGKQH